MTISDQPLRDVKESTLFRAASETVADLADLLQKEMRLARAEITDKLSTKLQAGIWMTAAIGVAAGMGREATAVVSTVMALFVLAVLRRVEARIAARKEASVIATDKK